MYTYTYTHTHNVAVLSVERQKITYMTINHPVTKGAQ